MHIRRPRVTPALLISCVALFAALSGTGYAASRDMTASNSTHLGWQPPNYYLPAHAITSSHGVRFFSVGQTVILGHAGPFTFSSTCSTDSAGQNQVTFDVTATTAADLDGNGPERAGTKVNIHTDSDALDSTTEHPLSAGEFAQVGSASTSTEIAANGEEANVFYTDGVNFKTPSAMHDCFAGYSGVVS